MKRFILPLLSAICLGLPESALAQAIPAPATGLILPLYGNTTVQFNAALEAAKVVPVIAIINPDDGVGERKDHFIAGKVAALKAAGAKIVGYVATGYGNQPLNQVQRQMDKYLRWYGVGGYFLDEMAGSTGKLPYYRTLRNRATGQGLSIVGNPGKGAAEGYASLTDVIITFEDAYADGWKTYTQPTWTDTLPATRLGAIVYSAKGHLLNSIIDRAITQRYGWVYVTDKNEPDPYGISATYFKSEVSYLQSKNIPAPVQPEPLPETAPEPLPAEEIPVEGEISEL
jgi:hypothetical protein